MTVEPRAWYKGAQQPKAVFTVRDREGKLWNRGYIKWLEVESDRYFPRAWSYLVAKHGPVTQVWP